MLKKATSILFPFLNIMNIYSFAQVQTGIVEYKTLGISFRIPEGWKGSETESGFLIGHDIKPGFIMISTHNYKSLEELKYQAKAGIQDSEGTLLQMGGEFDEPGENAIGAEFTGQMQWQPSKLYIAGMTNPSGYGLTIMSGTTTDQYNSTYRNLVIEIVKSVEFSTPEAGPIISQWKQRLTGSRLTYMESYSSTGGGYGGYSNTEKIDLCPNGSFSYYREGSISVDVGNVSGYSGGQDDGMGKWDIIVNVNGTATLLLEYNNGNTSEYELTYKDGVYLNGYRYYRTDAADGQEYAPQCY